MDDFQYWENYRDDVLCDEDGLVFSIVYENQHTNDQERQIHAKHFKHVTS